MQYIFSHFFTYDISIIIFIVASNENIMNIDYKDNIDIRVYPSISFSNFHFWGKVFYILF